MRIQRAAQQNEKNQVLLVPRDRFAFQPAWFSFAEVRCERVTFVHFFACQCNSTFTLDASIGVAPFAGCGVVSYSTLLTYTNSRGSLNRNRTTSNPDS